MSYIGNTSSVQQYAPQVAYFSGDASTVAFTLPVSVVSAAQIIVTVANVIQNPSSAFTVNGTTLTFTSAPPSGTNNIWVQYTTLQSNIVQPAAASVGLTQLSATGTPSSSTYLRGDNSWTALISSQWTTSSSDIYYTTGKVGIGTSSPATKLNVYETGALDALVRISNANGGVYAASLNVDSTNATGSRYNSIYSSNNNTYQWSINGGGADSTMALCTGSSNTQRMVIDSSGRVTKAYQPAFDAYGTVGNLSVTTDTPIPLTSTTYNVGGHYSTSTYRFTAPVAGIYFFRAQVYKQNSGNASRLRLYKNAGDVRVYQYISASDTYTHSITGIISLAAGDYVTCNFNSDGAGTNIYLADNHTNFSGYLLG